MSGDGDGEDGWRSGRMCWSTSDMKWRSEARFTLGMTRASRLGACRMPVRSVRARPDDTELIRTASSVTFAGRDWERKERMLALAAGFWDGVTESSRS